ncbi:hypothetical protein Ahia01_000518700 [Argonauta hians]
MPQIFHVVRCCECETFQVQQVKKVRKWSCKVCGQKQSLLREYGRGSGADCRRHVQKLNSLRQDIDHKKFEGHLAILCQPEMPQEQYNDDDSQYHYDIHEDQLGNHDTSSSNKWQKFLGSGADDEPFPENTEEDIISNSMFDNNRSYQNQRKYPKWSVPKSKGSRQPDYQDLDAFEEPYNLGPSKIKFKNISQHYHAPSEDKNSNLRSKYSPKKQNSTFNTSFKDTNSFSNSQCVVDTNGSYNNNNRISDNSQYFTNNSNHSNHRKNAFQSASYVSTSNCLSSVPNIPARAAVIATHSSPTDSSVKDNIISSSHRKIWPSLEHHSPNKDHRHTIPVSQRVSQCVSQENSPQRNSVQAGFSTSSKSSKWSHFLSSTSEADNPHDISDDNDNINNDIIENVYDDDIIYNNVYDYGVGADGDSCWGGNGNRYSSEASVDFSNDRGVNRDDNNSRDIDDSLGDPNFSILCKQYKRPCQKTPASENNRPYPYPQNPNKPNVKGYKQDVPCQWSNTSLPLNPVCQNPSVATPRTGTHKGASGVENMFNLDDNELDFTF